MENSDTFMAAYGGQGFFDLFEGLHLPHSALARVWGEITGRFWQVNPRTAIRPWPGDPRDTVLIYPEQTTLSSRVESSYVPLPGVAAKVSRIVGEVIGTPIYKNAGYRSAQVRRSLYKVYKETISAMFADLVVSIDVAYDPRLDVLYTVNVRSHDLRTGD